MSNTIYVKGNQKDVRRVMALIPRLLAGRASGHDDLVKSVKYLVANMALSKIQQAFIVKADGGTDECGEQWRPLTKKYLAYGRRFGKVNSQGKVWEYGDGKKISERTYLLSKAGLDARKNKFAPGAHYKSDGKGGRVKVDNTGLLTKDQLEEWRQVFYKTRASLMIHGRSPGEAESIAAGHAWNVMKAAGAKTKLEVFGNRKVQILRDTGILFNSLAFGVGRDADKPSGAPGQILKTPPGEVIIGTNVKYAKYHHKAKKLNRLRRLWIEPNKWPDSWWNDIRDVAKRGVARMAVEILQREAAA